MQITVRIGLQVAGMSDIAAVATLNPEAFDIIGPITLAPAAEDVEVDLSPASAEAQSLLLIVASVYADTLSYKVHADTEEPVILDKPHLFLGAQDSIAGAAFDKLFLSNSGVAATTVTFYVARDATP